MQPEQLSRGATPRVKSHLRAMADALTAAEAADDPAEAEVLWALYKRHRAQVDRLLPPDDRRLRRPS